ncbi:MAG: methionyl-tRNA formyltransferase [bacterium]|nr:methionyl-tRNA formyltransferase [bacterium]
MLKLMTTSPLLTSHISSLIFWGTSEFAIPPLEALLNEGYSIVVVVTTPDKPAGRKQLLTPPPVKSWLTKHGTWNTKIKILQPEKLSDENLKSEILNLKSDIFVVASYGKIIPADILALPKYGALNIHPSLLPRWRGPSPIQYTILNGDTETGVTIIKMDEKMDHGPIVANSKPQTLNSKTTYPELHDALAKTGAELLIETLSKWIAGEIKPIPQDESKATYSKMLRKEDGHIDWSRPAEEIERMVRAFNPWPGAYAFWLKQFAWSELFARPDLLGKSGLGLKNGTKLKINILKADVVTCADSASFGTVLPSENGFMIQTRTECLAIHELQLEGKKSTDAKSFLNGYPEFSKALLL